LSLAAVTPLHHTRAFSLPELLPFRDRVEHVASTQGIFDSTAFADLNFRNPGMASFMDEICRSRQATRAPSAASFLRACLHLLAPILRTQPDV